MIIQIFHDHDNTGATTPRSRMTNLFIIGGSSDHPLEGRLQRPSAGVASSVAPRWTITRAHLREGVLVVRALNVQGVCTGRSVCKAKA
jgi:hypothetical protein